jgi:glycosyltransferase involved in cell wall biosynthesis
MSRICMVVYSYYLRDPRVRREAEALSEAGHSVEVICLRDRGEEGRDRVTGVEIHRLPVGKNRRGILRYLLEYVVFFVLATVYLSFLHLSRRFDIIHVHNMPDFLVFSGLVPWIFGAKVLLDVHDPMPELFISQHGLGQHHWLLRMIRLQEKISYSFPCLILTVNESMRERIIGLGVNPEEVVTVFNSPDTSLFKTKARGEEGDGRDFALVYTGTIAKRYGLDVAIRAVALLAGEMPDLKLVLAGEGTCLESLQELAARLGVQDRVEFRGRVPLDEVAGILVDCDAGLSPHRNDCFWDLYFSTKIFEFLTVGLPVISSRTRTIEAYLKESLFYFEPEDVEGLADQVRLLRAKPELVKAKMSVAEEITSSLSWDKEKKKIQCLVSDLTSRQPACSVLAPDKVERGRNPLGDRK